MGIGTNNMTATVVRAHPSAELPRIEGFLFDVDGTLLLSDRALGSYEVLPGAIEALVTLKERSVPFALLTNGSAYPPQEQAARLRKIGLPVDDSQMITPSSVAADHLSGLGMKRVLVLGTRGVGQALLESGIQTVYTADPDASHVGAVYVGWHPDCGMKDIEVACNAIWAGAKLYAASDVPFFASKQGRTIGYTFAIIGAIRRLTKAPVTVTGKPSLRALRFVANRLGVAVRKMGVVGDDPIVEAIMARRGGATMFAVTTGIATFEDWQRQPAMRRPHCVLGDLRELLSTETVGA
jgi:HAD superfamily hydrolase (TIGR01450 family)